MSDTKRIVILGGGYGGVHAAKLLNKKFKKRNDIEITLIDKKNYHTLLTEIHEVAGARVEPDAVQISFRRIFGSKKVNVVTDNITGIDFDKKELKSESCTYNYDYLIMGTGSEPAFFGVTGVKENGFSLWSLDDAVTIKEHIKDMFKKASLERNAEKRQRMLTFAVAGAGFSGIETIGELAEWKLKLCKDYSIKPSDVKLMVIEALGSIIPVLTPELQAKAVKYLNKKGVEILTNSPIVEVTKDAVKLKDGREISTNTLIWTCGIQNTAFASSLNLSKARAARLKTNEFMQSVEYKDLYIIGDCSYYEETAGGRGLPQIVETALQTAETVVKNVTADIEGKEKAAFKSNYHGFMVSLGSRYSVARLGGMSLTGFIATFMKHLVNIHYLLGVGGFNTVWAYIQHEFFDARENRCMIGGHASRKSQTYWTVALRVYVGVMWIIESMGKIQQGWLNPDHIFIVKVAGTASASSSAQQTAQAAETTTKALLSSPPAFYTSFMNTFIAPHAFFFQASIVIGELVIGLALIAGLFTFLASLASIVLATNIILSAMAGAEILWYIFAGIALLGGSGRALGLDYYVMPWLKRWWNGTKLAQKTYLYFNEPSM